MPHTVLAVPVPALDDFVRERTEFYDASFLSADPDFVHAHITVLGPWVTHPSPADLDAVARIASRIRPTVIRMTHVEEFPSGLIHLRPEPAAPFLALTAALVEACLQAGDHVPVGHLLELAVPQPHGLEGVRRAIARDLDRVKALGVADVAARLSGHLPVSFTADRLDLQWWENNDCRLIHSWSLGGRDRGASI